MELTLIRTYYNGGTNGLLYAQGRVFCYTIELPWRENLTSISCIPEGQYLLAMRNSKKHGDHLLVRNVPGRSFILLHRANNARHDLQGCIAPVSLLTGPGRGERSGEALQKLVQLTYARLERGEAVWLRITAAETQEQGVNRPLPFILSSQNQMVCKQQLQAA